MMAGKLSYRRLGAKALSHSRVDLLNTCPKKFELEGKLNLRKRETNLTFAYGHAFGEGVQALVEGKTFEETVFEIFCGWDVDIGEEGWDSEKRNKKSFWDAIDMVEKFQAYKSMENVEGLEGNTRAINWNEWEIANFKDHEGNIRPAIELELVVECGNGYTYEGHIDLVLKRKGVDQFAVLELKSSGMNNIQPAMYGNSPQATGYMIALDTFLVKDNPSSTTSFSVFYLVGQTRMKKFYEFAFEKTPLHRTQWISWLINTIDRVESLENCGLPYPIDFQGCFKYNRPCPHFGTCHLPNDILLQNHRKEEDGETTFALEETPADVIVTLEEILERQEELLATYQTIPLAHSGDLGITFDEEDAGLSVGEELDILLDNLTY